MEELEYCMENDCNELATYFYMPGDSCYCERHVPRGCDCNIYFFSEFRRDYEPDENQPRLFWTKEQIEKYAYWDEVPEEVSRVYFEGAIAWEDLCEDGSRQVCCEFGYFNQLENEENETRISN